MSKSLSRTLCLIGIGIIILATILQFAGLAGSQTTTDANGVTTYNTIGNPALIGISIFLYVIGWIISFIAYIGALIKTATLGRWGWFVCLLVFSGIPMLIYIFAGPETRPYSQMPPPAYPQAGYPQAGYPQAGYPPSNYPQSGYSQGGYPPAGNSPSGYPPAGNPPWTWPEKM